MTNKVAKLFNEYKHTYDLRMDEIEKEIFKLASKNKSEFEALIKLFEEEDDLVFKRILAEILIKLNYKKLDTFLKPLLNDKDECNSYGAAILLLMLEDNDAISVIKHYVEHPELIPSHWILNDLKRIDNELAKNLYNEVYPTCMKNIK